MGKGDQKTKRGKIVRGTYGKSRPSRDPKPVIAAKAEAVVEEVKEAPAKKSKK